MLKEIGSSYMSDDTFIGAFMRLKNEGLDEFANRKMGDGDVANGYRERLERDIDGLQTSLKQANEKNKPPPQITHNPDSSNDNNVIGAIVGGAVGGPVGAAIGGVIGGLF